MGNVIGQTSGKQQPVQTAAPEEVDYRADS